ncbi:type III secretion protein [Brenneria roseae subsp. roseae]|uniref:type III secretion protein n=1 Tax=Brenneria roseae TaxID=1509241 RepID=UPI000D615A4D|nr:type III secretion protein [Brenneria roseae]PWC22415.1 type III secretion protein [Brenneria roseae subsp. roseae]
MPHDRSEPNELQTTLNLLLPIRRQRLSRSERQLRQETLTLTRIENQSLAHQRQLAALQQDCQRQRSAFTHQVQGRQQSLDNLKKRLADEQRLLHALETETRQHEASLQQHRDQQQQVETARQTTRRCQKAVEKLEFLLTLPQESP